MASTGTAGNKQPRTRIRKPGPVDARVRKSGPRAKPKAQTRVRAPFLPGSLNDQISKLEVKESYAKCERFDFITNTYDMVQAQTREFFNKQNSILSGGIAKVRGVAEHKAKRFKMERGTYMSASNDAMFAFLTVTRME